VRDFKECYAKWFLSLLRGVTTRIVHGCFPLSRLLFARLLWWGKASQWRERTGVQFGKNVSIYSLECWSEDEVKALPLFSFCKLQLQVSEDGLMQIPFTVRGELTDEEFEKFINNMNDMARACLARDYDPNSIDITYFFDEAKKRRERAQGKKYNTTAPFRLSYNYHSMMLRVTFEKMHTYLDGQLKLHPFYGRRRLKSNNTNISKKRKRPGDEEQEQEEQEQEYNESDIEC